jgi:uncharacterized protein (DUF58 family)
VPESAGIKLTLREKIEAEQKGESFPLSSRFEQGVSLTASMISYFTEEQAEVRLVIGSDVGEFGIGPRHLYDCLRRLATIDPKFTSETDQSELEATIERMLDDPDSGYCFLITATDGRPLSPEIATQLKIVGF